MKKFQKNKNEVGKYLPYLLRGFCLLLMCLLTIPSMQASVLKFEKNIRWLSFRDLTDSEFNEKFIEYKKDYILVDTESYEVRSRSRYAMVWRKNTDKRNWAAFRNMSSNEYHQKWAYYKSQGYRPSDIESYFVNGIQKYSGIWVKNKENYDWSSKRNLTASEYSIYFQEQKHKGFRVVDIEAYQTSEGLRYAAIWVQNKENISWAQFRDMSRSSYQNKVNEYSSKGYILVDLEVYKVGSSEKYATIWEKRSGFAYQVRTNLSELQFANLWRQYRDQGYI